MTAFKIVIGTKKGKCLQKELSEDESSNFIGKKIRDTISGDLLGFLGYEFEITGGSDNCGFPMRRDVDGTSRKKIFAVKGIGLKKKGKGVKVRKTVAGNTINEKTSQINLKVLKEGKQPLIEEKKEESKGAKAEEKKPEAKIEEKPKETEKKEVKEEKTETKKEPKEEKIKETEKKEEKPAEKKE